MRLTYTSCTVLWEMSQTMTKQFYISITVGVLEEIAVMGTDKFEQYVRAYVLNPTLLSESELELFTGTLAALGLLEYYIPSNMYGFAYIKYGVS